MHFVISVPEGIAPVTSRPHSINPIMAKDLAAGLIQHSTSPYSSPLMVLSKKCGGVRITVYYKILNHISILSQLPISRVGQFLASLGKGRVFSLFDVVSSFYQITARRFALPRSSTSDS